MTKLEQKLSEFGYEEKKLSELVYEYDYLTHYSKYCGNYKMIIGLYAKKRIENYYVEGYHFNFKNQAQIDNLQQAFNELQKDLEILKECEE